MLLRLHQQRQGPQQRRGIGIGRRRLQLDPVHPFAHKLHHRQLSAEVQTPMRADHHHPPVVDARLLIEQHRALHIQAPQKGGIGRHLRLQDHHRLLRGFLRGSEQAIQTPFTLL